MIKIKNLRRRKPGDSTVEVNINGKVVRGCHTKFYTYHWNKELVHIYNDQELECDLYDIISEIEVSEIPDNYEFEIIRVALDYLEAPLDRLPYPFNTIAFFKAGGKFYTRFSSYTMGDKWNMKWAVDHYFNELKQAFVRENGVVVRQEDLNEVLSEGGYYEDQENEGLREAAIKFDLLYSDALTISDAFEKALSLVTTVIHRVEDNLTGFGRLVSIIETWKINKENKTEEFWQKTLFDYLEIIAQVFSSPVVLSEQKAYLGGKSVDNTGGKEIDYIFKNKITDNIILVEIKTPKTNLLGSAYRGGYSLSKEFTGALVQLLKYKIQY